MVTAARSAGVVLARIERRAAPYGRIGGALADTGPKAQAARPYSHPGA
jgi:hypothetical protein